MKIQKPSFKLPIYLTLLLSMFCGIANATIFYSRGALAANTRTNWTTSSTGSGGLSPTTTEWAQSTHLYIIRNGDLMTTTLAWSLPGSLQIITGGGLTVGTNNSYTLTIGGTSDISGTLTLRNASNKIFTGNVTVNNGGVLDIQSTSLNVHVSSDLTVASGGTFKHNASYDNATCLLEIYGNLSIDGTYDYSTNTPAIWMNGSGTKYINTGNTSLWKLFLRTGNFYANGKITIDEEFFAMWNQVGGSFHTNNQIVNANWGVVISGGTFYVDGGTLTVANTVGGMLIGRTLTQDGDLQISSGTINISGGGIYLGTPSSTTPKGTCTMTGGTVNIDVLNMGKNCTFTQSGGTNNVNGNLDLNFSSAVYNQTATSTLNVAGTLTNNGVYNSTGTGTAALNIADQFTNNNTFTATSTSTVTFNGSGNSALNGSATTTFNNLILNKTASNLTVTNGSADKIFNVSNDLTVTSGNLVLEARDNDYTFSKNVTVATNGTLTHSVAWDTYSKKIGIGGNLNVTGIFNPTVRSHVQMNGNAPFTIQTGSNPASTLSILTMVNGNFTASGTLKANQEAWIMFGTAGAFTTNGQDVTFGALLNNNGTINMNLGGTLTVNGNTQIDFGAGGAMNISAGTVNLNGNLLINSATGVITCTNSPQINITGSWTNSGTFTPATSTVTFLGTANQTIGGSVGTSFNNLIINPSAGITVSSISNNISIVNNLTVSTGIFDLQTYTCNRTASGGVFSLASGTLLKAAGTNNFPQSFTTYTLQANSTTEYYGILSQSVYSTIYGHLTMSNNSTKTATGIVNIAGNLNINTSAIFAGSSYAHTIKGQWNNNVSASAYTGGTSTFTFNGTALQSIGGTAPTTFNKLTVNNSANVNISQDQTVNSTLTLTAGRLDIGTKNFTFGSSAPAVAGSPFTATNMIVADGGGEVRKNYSATGSFLFPIGDVTGTAEYSPITLNYTAGTFAGGAYSGVKLANAKHPNNASSTNYLNRYWTVSNSGITSPSFVATGIYLLADIAGTEATVAGAKYTGALPWVKYGVIGSNTLTTTAITNSGAGIIVSGITNQVPVGTISVGGVSLCLGNSASLSSSVTNNGTGSVSYAWSPAIGLSATNISNPVATPIVNRTYSLIVTDGNGITSTGDNSSLSVTTPPSASVAYNSAPFCYSSGTTSITFSGSAGGTYSGSAGISINASTGLVNLAASTPGSYTVNYGVAAAGGCPLFNTSAAIIINPNTWTGGVSNTWSTGGNWAAAHESGCPDITILAGAYQPILTSGTQSIQNLIIQSGASLTLSNTAKLQVSGTISNAGTFDISDGTLEMNGTSAQSLGVDSFVNNAVKHLIISNSSVSGVSLVRPLDIYGSLTFTGTGRKFNTNDTLTLKSNATNTAWVGDMTGNTITGKLTVERYNSQQKAWRFLSIPTNTNQTIKQAWQESGTSNTDNPTPGFGVQLTGAGGLAAGFDLYTATPSMKTYDPTSDAWVGVANTTTQNIKNTEGYMVFVRGNRTSNAYNSPVTESVVRTKGTLYTGDVGPISVTPDKMASIGNPYPSPIDFTKITKTNGVDDKFYLWDPFIPGSYNVGGYQTFSATNNWEPVPGGSTMYPTGVPNTTIQSGQAFFVHATTVPALLPVNYEVTFGENSKIGGSGLSSFSRPKGGSGTKSDKQFFRVSLFTGPLATDKIADGNAVAFNENYNNEIDGNDALKIPAGGENFDVKRSTKLLAVEARGSITNADTIYYNMSKLVAKTYQLRFAPVNMGSDGMEAFLIDKYLNTTTPVSLTDSSFINITVNADAASKAADRFKVVFKTMAVLPVTVTSIAANEENGNVIVTWKVENETNMASYEIEKSTDGISYVKIGEVPAKNLKSGEYKWLDQNKVNGYNYYRIRSVDMNGKVWLTQVVKVLIGLSVKASISVYPNPVVNQVINVQMANNPAGKYQFKLLNIAGQLIVLKRADFAGGTGTVKIEIDKKLANGIYHLEITKPDGEKKVIKINN